MTGRAGVGTPGFAGPSPDGAGPLRSVWLVEEPGAVEATAAALRSDGWSVQSGFVLPPDPWRLPDPRLLCSGVVRERGDAVAALTAGLRTAGLVLAVDVDGDVAADLLADLARLGPPVPGAGAGAGPSPGVTPRALPLSPEQLELLELVAAGRSVPEAAADLYLSKRTSERRLALARRALGVRSTPAAIAALLAHRRGTA